MKALVVGASSGIGRSLSDALAAAGHSLLLAARDTRDLEAQASHLRVTYRVQVEHVAADATDPEAFLDALVAACERFGEIEGLFFPIGASSAEDMGTLSLAETRRLLDANLVTVMGVAGHFLPKLLARTRGCIVGFGSVSAVRGRNSNVVYAAAKRGLVSYFESLRRIASGSGVRVQLYQLGYVDTQQSYGKRLLFRPAPPEWIAAQVVRNLHRDFGTRYLPRYWALIARLVSALPWAIFKRLNF